MTEFIQKIVLSIFGENPVLATIFISMIPVIELRGAIPFGSSKEIWGDNALSVLEASIYSLIGSLIAAIVIILLMIPVFNLLKKTKIFNNLVDSFEDKFKKQSKKIEDEAKEKKHTGLKKWLGITMFVAIPLPLTGVWTGSAVAVFLNMGFLKSLSAVSVGALVAACIMSFLSNILGDAALIVFYCFIGFFIIVISFYLIRAFIKKKDKNVDEE